MVKYYCDRCEEETAILNTITYNNGSKIDICDTCNSDLSRFMQFKEPVRLAKHKKEKKNETINIVNTDTATVNTEQ